MIRSLCLALLAVALAGCGLLSSANQFAGLNHAEAEFTEDGQIERIVFYGGKESGSVNLTVDLGNGATATFSGTDVTAFEGQAVRAEVEKAQAEVLGEVVPALTKAIVDAVVGVP